MLEYGNKNVDLLQHRRVNPMWEYSKPCPEAFGKYLSLILIAALADPAVG
jgi:hypothetical protein